MREIHICPSQHGNPRSLHIRLVERDNEGSKTVTIVEPAARDLPLRLTEVTPGTFLLSGELLEFITT